MELKHGDDFTFGFTLSLDDLIFMGDYEQMNNWMDEQFEIQFGTNYRFILTDVSYSPTMITGTNDIVVEATGILEDTQLELDELQETP